MNEALKEALSIISGDKTGGYYIAGAFFSFLGILISLYHSSRKRDKDSPNTPYKFSWIFLLWDNAKRAGISLVVMFLLFRMFDLSNVGLMIGAGVGVTIFLDKIIEFLMSKYEGIAKLMEMDRSKLTTPSKE